MLRRPGVLKAPSTASRKSALGSFLGSHGFDALSNTSKEHTSTVNGSGTVPPCTSVRYCRVNDSGYPHGSVAPTPRSSDVGRTPML